MDTLQITHNNLPEAIGYLTGRVDHLIELLSSSGPAQSDTWFGIDELCQYRPDKPSKSTVYAEVSHRKIPFHKRSKKLIFLKSEIDQWLAGGKQLTGAEVIASAHSLLKR